jgi:hypothetical protein
MCDPGGDGLSGYALDETAMMNNVRMNVHSQSRLDIGARVSQVNTRQPRFRLT